jgi:cellulose synthase/poly-beta-1,6-N-acetylglucosamine synthase-like glycosyltransferase
MPNLDKIKWGNGAITRDDWVILRDFILENNIKSVIEYGYGVSTVLISEIVKNLITFETLEYFFKLGVEKGFKLVLWEGDHYVRTHIADMVFIDGPIGGQNREWSFKNAVRQSNIIAVHDAQRKEEKQWIKKYLSGYKLIAGRRLEIYKGGNDG